MSQTKLRIVPRTGDVVALRPRRATILNYVAWCLVPPQGDESCRWSAADGRWVSVTLCHGEDMTKVVVEDSSGRRQLVDSYEGALALARSWRE